MTFWGFLAAADSYIPTILHCFHGSVQFEGTGIRVESLDPAGYHDFDRIRRLQYPMANVFAIIFAIGFKLFFRFTNSKI